MISMGKTIKLGILSDTHIPTRARELPKRLGEVFGDVDHIIHAGDYVNYSVIVDLQKLAPITGCYGNMDPTTLKNKLPKVATIKLDDWVIKIIHNLGSGSRIKEFQKSGVNIIIHGHTHRSSVKREKNLLIINPGSATNSFSSAKSVGVLYLTQDSTDVEIIPLR